MRHPTPVHVVQCCFSACVHPPARKSCGRTTATSRVYWGTQLTRNQRVQGSDDALLCPAFSRAELDTVDPVHTRTDAGFCVFLLGRFVRLLEQNRSFGSLLIA